MTMIFTLKNKVGSLVRALEAFANLGINLLHIESRPSLNNDNQADIFVEIECDSSKLEELGRLLKREVLTMCIGNFGTFEKDFTLTPLSTTTSFGNFYTMIYSVGQNNKNN